MRPAVTTRPTTSIQRGNEEKIALAAMGPLNKSRSTGRRTIIAPTAMDTHILLVLRLIIFPMLHKAGNTIPNTSCAYDRIAERQRQQASENVSHAAPGRRSSCLATGSVH